MSATNCCPTCRTPGIVQDGTFLPLPPLRIARRYADAELADRATPAQVQWLHQHPVLWLRALMQVKYDINVHIAKDRNDLTALKPKAGEHPTKEYLAAKHACDSRSTGRLHVQRITEKRIDEVKSLIGSERVLDRLSVGDLVEIMTKIAELADRDEVGAIAQLSRHFANQWAVAEAVAR